MLNTNLGKNIKEILYSKRISQIELAEKIGVHKQVLSNWIRGVRNPKEENLDRLAKALNVTVKDLLKKSDKKLVFNPQKLFNVKIKVLEEKVKFQEEQIKHFKERISFLEKELSFYKNQINK